LELRKKPWNATVSCPKNNELEETFERRLIKVNIIIKIDKIGID